MKSLDQLRHILGLHVDAKSLRLQVVRHPLLTAADLQQIVVFVHTPFHVEPELGESPVERHTVAISLRVDNHSVLIEDERPDLTHALFPPASSAFPPQPSRSIQ